MSALEHTPSTNPFEAGPIIDAPPELLAYIEQVREEEYVSTSEDLLSRNAHGEKVELMWHPPSENGKRDDKLTVRVTPSTPDDAAFELIGIPGDRAVEAYEHPYSFQANALGEHSSRECVEIRWLEDSKAA